MSFTSAAPAVKVLNRTDWKTAKTCERCHRAFTLLHRSHHCRTCGAAVCGNCSRRTIPVDGTQQRVCDDCFNARSLSMYKGAEEQAKQRLSLHKAGSGSSASELRLEPPPKREGRKPLKLQIPASLSHLQPSLPASAETSTVGSIESPLSPSFASQSSPTSTSSASDTSVPGSAVSSPASTPTHHAANGSAASTTPPLKESQVNLPSVPSVAALTASPAFQAFRSRVTAFHGAIATAEQEWERRLEKRLRAERPDLRDRLAHVRSIVDAMRKEQQRREASGAPTSREDGERLAYFLQLQADYATHLDAVDLDIYFPDPTSRRFKLRVNAADERISIAAEDVALERVSGVLKASVKGNRMQLELSDVHAIAIVYHFSLAGKGTHVWGRFVKPDRVSVQLTINRILIPLTYYQPHNAAEVGRWIVDRAAAVFDLHVVKSIRGSASVPDSLIAWIVNQQLPKAVLGAFDDLVPGEVGQLFVAGHAQHHIAVEGAFDISCAFSNSVWEADLAGIGADSEAARQLLLRPGSAEAASTSAGLLYTRMHLLLNVVVAARLQKLLPALTLRDVARYIRQFSCSVDETAQTLWLNLLTEWQLQLNELENTSSLWFFNLIERCAELDDKPLVLHFAPHPPQRRCGRRGRSGVVPGHGGEGGAEADGGGEEEAEGGGAGGGQPPLSRRPQPHRRPLLHPLLPPHRRQRRQQLSPQHPQRRQRRQRRRGRGQREPLCLHRQRRQTPAPSSLSPLEGRPSSPLVLPPRAREPSHVAHHPGGRAGGDS